MPGCRRKAPASVNTGKRGLRAKANAWTPRKVNPSTECTDGIQRHGTQNNDKQWLKSSEKRRSNASINRVTHTGKGHSRFIIINYYYYYTLLLWLLCRKSNNNAKPVVIYVSVNYGIYNVKKSHPGCRPGARILVHRPYNPGCRNAIHDILFL